MCSAGVRGGPRAAEILTCASRGRPQPRHERVVRAASETAMKLYVVTSQDTPLACTGSDLTDALRAAASQRPEITLVPRMEEADALVMHEMFSFKEQRYVQRLLSDPVAGRFGYKLYVINFDDCATGLLKGLYTSMPSRRFDPRLHAAIPYFRYHNPVVFQSQPTVEPKFLAAWRGNEGSHPLRKQMLERWKGDARFWLESTQSWYNHGENEQVRFVEMIRTSKFSLCPGGLAPTSFRIFESMALGRAPVIMADQFVYPAGLDWAEFSVQIPERDEARLGEILEARAGAWEKLGRAAKAAWDAHFARPVVATYYLEQILRLYRARSTETQREEAARWRSRALWVANGWTLQQRLGRKLRSAMRIPQLGS